MSFRKRQRGETGELRQIACWTIFDAQVGAAQHVVGPNFVMEPEAGLSSVVIFETEEALSKLKVGKRIKIPTWRAGGRVTAKDGGNGRLLELVIGSLCQYEPGYRYGPYSEPLFQFAADPKRRLLDANRNAFLEVRSDDPSPSVVGRIEDLLNDLAAHFQTDAFRAQLRSREKEVRSRERSANALIHAAIALGTAVRFVQIDHFLPGPWSFDPATGLKPLPFDADSALWDVLRARRKFVKRIDDIKGYREVCLGFMHFLCGGPTPGPYVHGIYLMRDDLKATKALESAFVELWTEHSGGVGFSRPGSLSNNPYRKKLASRYLPAKSNRIDDIYRSIRYLTHKDWYFSPILPLNVRGYWRSQLPRADKAGPTIVKQKRKVDRLLSTRKKSSENPEKVIKMVRESAKRSVSAASRVRKPTEAETFTDDNPYEANARFHKAQVIIDEAIVLQAAADRALIDEARDARVLRDVNRHGENPFFRAMTDSKFERAIWPTSKPVGGVSGLHEASEGAGQIAEESVSQGVIDTECSPPLSGIASIECVVNDAQSVDAESQGNVGETDDRLGSEQLSVRDAGLDNKSRKGVIRPKSNFVAAQYSNGKKGRAKAKADSQSLESIEERRARRLKGLGLGE